MIGWKRSRCTALLTMLALATPAWAGSEETAETHVEASNSLAALHEFGGEMGAPPLLLFHMAASNSRGEYAQIAPRLVEAGYHVFGADLNSGGERFGYDSLAQVASESSDYCADYDGMAAAIDAVVSATGQKPVLIGSSYSAALVMKAAVERPEHVSGFVSFSPAPAAGLETCAPGALLAELETPGLAVRPRNEVEYDIVVEQAREWASYGVITKIVEVRSHGASVLDVSRAGAAADDFWPGLIAFLSEASDLERRGG